MVLALAIVACASPAAPAKTASDHDEPTIVARWVAEDGSVVALNVVVPAGTQPRDLPRLARDLRARHPSSRVIVTFFAPRAGPERYVIGHMPAGDEPLVRGPRPDSWLGTYEFSAMAGR